METPAADNAAMARPMAPPCTPTRDAEASLPSAQNLPRLRGWSSLSGSGFFIQINAPSAMLLMGVKIGAASPLRSTCSCGTPLPQSNRAVSAAAIVFGWRLPTSISTGEDLLMHSTKFLVASVMFGTAGTNFAVAFVMPRHWLTAQSTALLQSALSSLFLHQVLRHIKDARFLPPSASSSPQLTTSLPPFRPTRINTLATNNTATMEPTIAILRTRGVMVLVAMPVAE
mmetsp:Transcript_85852/g.247926  ORF Transcript_85852/g.247926 Transcript_85852/m.247926 type:complete len:228 (-) Transcript_85852:79-762(-)